MRRLGVICGTVLLWLVLCMLFLTSCQMSALGNASAAAEYTLFENLYLFVSTDYGEFCALIACLMATHLTYLLQRYLVPLLQQYAPRAAEFLCSVCKKAQGALKAYLGRKSSSSDTADDLFSPDTKEASSTEDASDIEQTSSTEDASDIEQTSDTEDASDIEQTSDTEDASPTKTP